MPANPSSDIPFDENFVIDVVTGESFAIALERHVTGLSKVRRAVAIQTLQAIAGLPDDHLSNLLAWAKNQKF
jgi:hypothetical protein